MTLSALKIDLLLPLTSETYKLWTTNVTLPGMEQMAIETDEERMNE